mgnify:CR=1 FL=1
MATSQMLFSRSKAVGGPQAAPDGEGNEDNGGGQGPFGGARLTWCTVGVLEVGGTAKVSSFVPCRLLCLPSLCGMAWEDVHHQLVSVPDLLESSQKVAGCLSDRSFLLEQETLRPQKNHSL